MKKHGGYGALLFRNEWKSKRKVILDRDNHKCRVCDTTEELEVHHRQYIFIKQLQKFNDPWEYPNQALITLCKSCHGRGHSKFEIPIIYI